MIDPIIKQHANLELHDSGHLIVLKRETHGYNSTLGTIYVKDRTFNTIELPWKDNARNISRIPAGVYFYRKTQRYSNGKNCLWLQNVPNRSQILVHVGSKPQHSEGCILAPAFEHLYQQVETNGLIVILD